MDKRKSIAKNDANRIDEVFGDHIGSVYPLGDKWKYKGVEAQIWLYRM